MLSRRLHLRTGSSKGIDSLPLETLLDIFDFATACTYDCPETIGNAFIFPIVISHVNRRWRKAALTSSRLWRWIVICEPVDRPFLSITSAACRERVCAFLSRSKSCPLSIHLDLRAPSWVDEPTQPHPVTEAHIQEVVQLLVPHLARWESLDILCDSQPIMRAFLTRYSNEAETRGSKAGDLKRLALRICNGFLALEETPTSAREDVGGLPFPFTPSRLRDVTIAGVRLDWGRHHLASLTSLCIDYLPRAYCPTSAELITLLDSCPELHTLSLLGWGVRSFSSKSRAKESSSPPGEQCRQVALLKILHLSLGWVSIKHALGCLSIFSWNMPRLEALLLEDVGNRLDARNVQDSTPILRRLLQCMGSALASETRTCLSIKCLTLRYIHSEDDSYEQLFQLTPNLESLHLDNTNEPVISILGLSRGQWALSERRVLPKSILQNLSHLHVRTCSHAVISQLRAKLDERATRHARSTLRLTFVDNTSVQSDEDSQTESNGSSSAQSSDAEDILGGQ